MFCTQNQSVFASLTHSSDSESKILRFDLEGGSKGTHTYVAQNFWMARFPTFALRGGNFVQWAHLENAKYRLQSSGGIYMQGPTLSAFRSALSLVTRAAWFSHLSYRLNVKLKLFLLPALKRLRTLLLVGRASALLPLFKAFTVINDGVNPSLACLPQCKPGCNHPFSCSSHPAFPGCQPALPRGGQRRVRLRLRIWLPSLNVCHCLSVFAHTHVIL